MMIILLTILSLAIWAYYDAKDGAVKLWVLLVPIVISVFMIPNIWLTTILFLFLLIAMKAIIISLHKHFIGLADVLAFPFVLSSVMNLNNPMAGALFCVVLLIQVWFYGKLPVSIAGKPTFSIDGSRKIKLLPLLFNAYLFALAGLLVFPPIG